MMYGINPKERYTLRVTPYAYGDYIICRANLKWLVAVKKEVNNKTGTLMRTCFVVGSPCWARTSDPLI